MQLHRALRVAGHDDCVLHFDQILGLHLGQSRAHLEGGGGVVESHYDKVAHVYFLWSVDFAVLLYVSLGVRGIYFMLWRRSTNTWSKESTRIKPSRGYSMSR